MSSDQRPARRASPTRERILDAAAHLMGTVGIIRTTTKEIAREAGCSEAALYKHFRDKEDLFVRVLHEREPQFSGRLGGLAERAGSGSLRERLVELVVAAVPFYRRTFPMAASLFAAPDLLAAHRAKMVRGGTGPQEAVRALAGYLRAEQAAGRIAAGADPEAAAMMLVGACFHRAFLSAYGSTGPAPEGAALPDPDPRDDAEFAEALVSTFLAGAGAGSAAAESAPSEGATS